MSMYSNDNQGNFPRTLYVAVAPLTEGTGINAVDPFQPGGVSANDLTAAVYLLLRAEHLPTELFICPYNDATSYSADPANPQSHCNFTDWTKNLSYSFADPYPDSAAVNAGYRLTNHIRGDFPMAGDLNPGVKPPFANVAAAVPGVIADHRKRQQPESRAGWGECAICRWPRHVPGDLSLRNWTGQYLHQSIEPGYRKPAQFDGCGSFAGELITGTAGLQVGRVLG